MDFAGDEGLGCARAMQAAWIKFYLEELRIVRDTM